MAVPVARKRTDGSGYETCVSEDHADRPSGQAKLHVVSDHCEQLHDTHTSSAPRTQGLNTNWCVWQEQQDIVNNNDGYGHEKFQGEEVLRKELGPCLLHSW